MTWSDIYPQIRVITFSWWRNIQNYKFNFAKIFKLFKLLKTINLSIQYVSFINTCYYKIGQDKYTRIKLELKLNKLELTK